MLPSQKTIGIIGGGQLGKMLMEAGKPWNLKYHILDTADAPASALASKHIVGGLMDADKILELASECDVITYEIEHIHLGVLKELEAKGKIIIPSPKILEIIQDKGLQKLFFKQHNIPTTDFELAENQSEWTDKLQKLKGDKVAAKLRKGGYDGKGVELIVKKDILEDYNKIPFSESVVLEEFVENAIELSVIVARNSKGEICTFPTVEMEFDPKANLVEFLFSPANIDSKIEEKAKNIAKECILKMQGIGVFAVEMFLDKNNEIFVNEIAPRPHNSGHHTIEACYTSQYEQLNRILIDLPLGNTDLICPSAMLNLLGAEDVNGAYEITGLDTILSLKGVYIHLYNKSITKPKRKMGHITVLGESIEEVKQKAAKIKAVQGMKQL
ncbi:MAG: 5-(carboxyamino)imidazole ribonucleotide synthase [Bacteroidia bacterium]|nr:5-(carboxyamino)imidazole ribonucleotide synthase [Bacteroidia bacterium]